jgi:hypothetical protein
MKKEEESGLRREFGGRGEEQDGTRKRTGKGRRKKTRKEGG